MRFPIHLVRTIQCANVVSIYTCADISNIYKVKLALRNVSNNWQNLGLALGLSYHTLKSIRTTERDIADQCMREMIAAWLAKKDNVPRIGTPSWPVLQAALREIGENQVADHIRVSLANYIHELKHA